MGSNTGYLLKYFLLYVNQLRVMYRKSGLPRKKTQKSDTLSNWKKFLCLSWLPKWPKTANLFNKFGSTSIINSQGQRNQWAKYNSFFPQSIFFFILYAFASFFHWDVCLNAVYRTWKDKMVMVAQPNALVICLLKLFLISDVQLLTLKPQWHKIYYVWNLTS